MLAYEMEIFDDLKPPVKSLGEFYRRLTKAFPLVPIESRRHHKLAGDLMVKLTRLENAGEIPEHVQGDIDKFLTALGLLIEDYEKKHYPIDTSYLTPRDKLLFLMEQHGLTQTDLAQDLGGQGNVSKVLKGERDLSKSAIKALAKRFGVSTDLFIS